MICLILSVLILWLLTGCMVDQHPEDARTTAVETVETMLTITDPVEKAAVEKAKSEVRAMDADWAFLNLRSVQGMYRSIQELGEIFDREDQAQTMVEEFQDYYEEYKSQNEGKAHPKVMILMGLPGSYIIATENSYVGSLVELAGGENVYAGTDQEFLTVNTEDMEKRIRTSSFARRTPCRIRWWRCSKKILRPTISGNIFLPCKTGGSMI